MQNRTEQNFYFKIALRPFSGGIICEKSRNIRILAWQDEKISLLWTYMHLVHKTRQRLCNSRRTDPSTHWNDQTAISVMAAPVTEWARLLISTLLILRSPHRYGRCWFEPRTGHMWDKLSSACGGIRWFSWDTIFSPHLPIGSFRYE